MKSLINTSRLRPSSVNTKRSKREEIESDRGRVLFSAPLRRLQSKAQVFSLESNAAVRSRLTHSLEVAHIGRYIAQKIIDIANKENKKLEKFIEELIDSETIIETACLLHDIGNPPFGHLGERAIQQWFRKNAEKLYSESCPEKYELDKSSAHYKDFLKFDGNPQGLRICMTLQGKPGKCGFNLTYSQIASLIKYPIDSSENNSEYKKIGVFQTEVDKAKKVWKGLNLEWGVRSPLAYLMEAADDIAYSLSDIEDGIEKKIITESDILEKLEEEFKKSNLCEYECLIKEAFNNSITSKFITFRTCMINKLVKCAAERFYELYTKDKPFPKSIFSDSEAGKAIEIINKYCKNTIYNAPEAEDIEIAGYNIVYGLLNKFSILLKLRKSEFKELVDENKGHDLCKRMFSKLPKNLVDHYSASTQDDEENEWYYRVHLIVDYVSGMTDDFALKVYRLLNGIDVGVI